MYSQITKLEKNCLVCAEQLREMKRSIFAFLFCLPTSFLAVIFFLLLLYNGFVVFNVHVPFPSKPQPEPANFSKANLAGNSLKKLPSSEMYAVKEDTPAVILKTLSPLLQNTAISTTSINHVVSKPKKAREYKAVKRMLRSGDNSKQFSTRIKDFLGNHGCKVRFFMTWISSLKPFGDRELFAIESLFKSHPYACLVIVSNSMDAESGSLVLKPFLDQGFKLIAIKPDFDYIFKDTHAEKWFQSIKERDCQPW
ncbi:hypothetical protein OIU76_029159 [Salix suchowensis]|nr:hypothetical protein OIU76_029159 [Salix suchowensis]